MPDHAAFLADILAHPDDDVPRLVYADWLDEQGDPRGEFIRVQCLLEQLPYEDPRRWALGVREELLRRQYAKGWANPIRHVVKDFRFRRGFVEHIKITAEDFLTHAPTLFTSAPIQSVRLLEPNDQLSALSVSPWMEKIRALNVGHTYIEPDQFADFLFSPSIVGLRSLSVSGIQLWLNGYQSVFHLLNEADFLQNLKSLYVNQCHPVDGFPRFIESPIFQRLESFSMARYGDLGFGLLRTLAISDGQSQLKTMNFNGCNPKNQGFDDWVRSHHVSRLEHLSLGDVPSDECLAAIADSTNLRNLKSLKFSSRTPASDAFIKLCESPNAENLIALDLSDGVILKKAIDALVTSERFGKLQSLKLNKHGGDPGVSKRLKRAKFLPQLRSLELSATPGEEPNTELAALIKSGKLAQVECLDLSHQIIPPISAELSHVLPNLRSLNLHNSLAPSFVDCAEFSQLELLDIRSTSISKELILELKDRFGAGLRYDNKLAKRSRFLAQP